MPTIENELALLRDEVKSLKDCTNVRHIMEQELKLLRGEMDSLKDCQTRYVALAVTAVGAIISYLIRNRTDVFQTTDYIMWLIPLLILLPFSRIFFDKAVIVSRIVGYYQILEEFNLNKHSSYYIGWENSLSRLRNMGRSNEKKLKMDFAKIELWDGQPTWYKIAFFSSFFGLNLQRENEFKQMPTYWRSIYIIFCSLAAFSLFMAIFPLIQLICNSLSITTIKTNVLPILVTIVLLLISVSVFKYNLKSLYQLERGFHSYKTNRVLWETILLEDESIVNHRISKVTLPRTSVFKKNAILYLYLICNSSAYVPPRILGSSLGTARL